MPSQDCDQQRCEVGIPKKTTLIECQFHNDQWKEHPDSIEFVKKLQNLKNQPLSSELPGWENPQLPQLLSKVVKFTQKINDLRWSKACSSALQ
jgi:hypothetical protein